MKRIMALDLSTKRSGYCTKINDEIIYGAVSKSSDRVEKRIIDMVADIIELVKKYNIKELVCEEVRPDNPNDSPQNKHTNKVLMWLQGVLAIEIFKVDPHIKINFMNPSEWRSKLNLQGYKIKRDEQKKRDIAYVYNKYNIVTLDDEADAIGIYDAWTGVEISNEAQKKAAAAGFDFA